MVVQDLQDFFNFFHQSIEYSWKKIFFLYSRCKLVYWKYIFCNLKDFGVLLSQCLKNYLFQTRIPGLLCVPRQFFRDTLWLGWKPGQSRFSGTFGHPSLSMCEHWRNKRQVCRVRTPFEVLEQKFFLCVDKKKAI